MGLNYLLFSAGLESCSGGNRIWSPRNIKPFLQMYLGLLDSRLDSQMKGDYISVRISIREDSARHHILKRTVPVQDECLG